MGNYVAVPLINTIMHLVVRQSKTVVVIVDGQECVVQWNKLQRSPEIIEPGTTQVIHGIYDVMQWLATVEIEDFKIKLEA